MPTGAKKPFITPEEYLAAERLAEFKSEYYDGQVYAMAGTSFRHWAILSNFLIILGHQLRGGPCQAGASDLRLGSKTSSSYMYPDLMVICGPPVFAEGVFDTVLNPTVIIEVLSPSTESWDRGGKFAHYRRLDSLTDYVLVSQDRMLVEHYARQGDQWLLTERSAAESTLDLESIHCEVLLSDIYAKVSFETET